MRRRALPALAIAMFASSAAAQTESGGVYVAAISGKWLTGASRQLTSLAVLGPADTVLWRDTTSRASTDSIVFRDSRTLRTTRLRCAPAALCRGRTRLSSMPLLETPRVARLPRSPAGRIFVRLGSDQLGARMKVAGARSEERELGLLVLAASPAGHDMEPLLARLPSRASRTLVVRFCPLQGDSTLEVERCLEDRDLKGTDCELTATSVCAKSSSPPAPVAVRIDVYERERTMLGSVSVATGFGVLVPTAEVRRVSAERDAIVQLLESSRPELGPGEFHALLASAALALAERR